MQRKVRALGLRVALSSKLHTGTLRIVDNLNAGAWTKTKQAVAALTTGWKWIPREGYVAPENDFTEGEIEEAKPSTEAEVDASKAEIVEEVEEAEEAEEVGTPEYAEGEYESGKYVWGEGFGEPKDLSVLFLHAPEKSAQAVRDFALPLRNVPGVEIMSTDDVQVYHILKYRWLVMEPGAIDSIVRQKGQIEPQTWVFPEAEVPAETAVATGPTSEEESVFGPLRNRYILNQWRKIRGSKSMRATFGLKFTNEYQTQAKRAWKRLRWSGFRASPDLVNLELTKRKTNL